uniref:NADH-ubiquinone oxidoreductase chain 4L n=1 Tax=Neostromboceros nipponicus TaxID=2805799 RepID=A0A8A6C3Q9_9HYME|nr:NADH dehydrogenase subunit 4L [Neostromboceros nipponicus]QTH79156.1 NADH dehydrogenase subunit 4L [Neostromboceros nipponicus]UQS76354.1 NADH dehydrogenase subunit 4L [Neostromboceros nipponicus]
MVLNLVFEYLFILIFFMGLIKLCMNHFNLLMILLSLEFIILLIYMMIMFYLNMIKLEMYFNMFFLVFSVCEGVLGLSILILMVRYHGNDNFQVLSIL